MSKKRLLRIIVIASLSYLTFSYVLMPYRFESTSKVGIFGYTFVNKINYLFSEPNLGDQIVAKIFSKKVAFTAEIIAASGDTVETINGELFINNIKIENTPIHSTYAPPKTLKANEFLLKMITPPHSALGVINKQSIIGKLL